METLSSSAVTLAASAPCKDVRGLYLLLLV